MFPLGSARRPKENPSWVQGHGRPGGHSRSFSHPFPSLFGGGKRSDPVLENCVVDSSDDSDCVIDVNDPRGAVSPIRAGQSKNSTERGTSSGKCMTCDSLVRWPSDIHIFRCTICLTINDLESNRRDDSGLGGRPDSRHGRASSRPDSNVVLDRIPPLSVERAQSIIDRCLTDYLLDKISNLAPSADGQLLSPPQSPTESRRVPTTSSAEGSAGTTVYPSRGDFEFEHMTSSPITFSPTAAEHPYQLPEWKFPTSDSGHVAGPALPPVGSTTPHFAKLGRSSHGRSVPAPPSRHAPIPRFSSRVELSDAHRSQGHGEAKSPARPTQHTSRDFEEGDHRTGTELPRSIFKPLELHIMTSFNSLDCLNSSFSTGRPGAPTRAASEGSNVLLKDAATSEVRNANKSDQGLSDLDAKTLLLGDFAENGSWWTGTRTNGRSPSHTGHRRDASYDDLGGSRHLVSPKTPRIDWVNLSIWYHIVLSVGTSWRSLWRQLHPRNYQGTTETDRREEVELFRALDEEIEQARSRVQRTLLKACETLLKRPGRVLRAPDEIRFLLILLANPLLHSPTSTKAKDVSAGDFRPDCSISFKAHDGHRRRASGSADRPAGGAGQHAGIIKRILGLLANLPNDCHRHLVAWFSRFSETHFQRVVELIGSFVTYRLTRQHERPRSKSNQMPSSSSSSLIPSLDGASRGTSAQLHHALGLTAASQKEEQRSKIVVYAEDWQIKAAARVQALLFAANNGSGGARRGDASLMTDRASSGLVARQRGRTPGQKLPTSSFYNTLLDYSDLIADFEAWESRRGKFAFCQYPFFLSIGAKIHIMEHDARRQMEVKAREAFFDSILSRKAISQYLVLKVRRDCLVEDSLRRVSEVVGTGQEEIKKGLRIEFRGEEGIDGGGLRKEWFLLLVREIFDPEHGLFVYDEDSHYCYFNPHTFEPSDQFFLVGVLLGLAIYNSTILDIPFPPFLFKKLLASAPCPNASPHPIAASSSSSSSNPTVAISLPTFTRSHTYTLEELAELHPALASGLQQLLLFTPPEAVETTFSLTFTLTLSRYGQPSNIPLCPDGLSRAVTGANRREYVDLYLHHLLDTAVARQFEPFKRGFYTVCGGNALSLFRPEEIESLVRGSDEPLNIDSLRAVAVYEGWGASAGPDEPVVSWFWDFFDRVDEPAKRRLLGFVTGSDRIPAMGGTNLVIRIVKGAGGSDQGQRFPVARTCFNQLILWSYRDRATLELKLWRAVTESEGFGLR